jgi:hypothetical protein
LLLFSWGALYFRKDSNTIIWASCCSDKIDDLAGNLPRRIVVEMADFLPQVIIVWDVVL